MGQPGGSVGEEGEDPGEADQPGDVGDRPAGQRGDGKDYSQEPEGWVTPLINILYSQYIKLCTYWREIN